MTNKGVLYISIIYNNTFIIDIHTRISSSFAYHHLYGSSIVHMGLKVLLKDRNV